MLTRDEPRANHLVLRPADLADHGLRRSHDAVQGSQQKPPHTRHRVVNGNEELIPRGGTRSQCTGRVIRDPRPPRSNAKGWDPTQAVLPARLVGARERWRWDLPALVALSREGRTVPRSERIHHCSRMKPDARIPALEPTELFRGYVAAGWPSCA